MNVHPVTIAMTGALRTLAMTTLLSLILPVQFAGAQTQPPDSLDGRLHSLEERMKRLEEGQKEIVEHQKELLAAIDNLRVWIRSS